SAPRSLWATRLYWGPQQHLREHAAARPDAPAAQQSRSSRIQFRRATARDNDEACSTAVSARLRSADCRSHPAPHSVHIQQPVYDNGQLTVRMLILGCLSQRGDALQGAVAAAVCIDSAAATAKLFQMTVVAETRLLPADSAAVQLPLFRPLIPMDSPASKAALRNITRCFRTPSCDEVKLASGSPPPEQCPAALETQLPEPPGRIQLPGHLDSGASAGRTASDSSTSHRVVEVEERRSAATASSGGPVLEERSASPATWPPQLVAEGRRRLRQDRRLRQAPSLQAS
uniref:Velvet domain-containing protein n=1 Tax=Macrostomum lignano TaxID=282301 RepID=A0A1I8FG69_9PLAT